MRNVCQGRDVCQYLEQRHSKPRRGIQYRGKKHIFMFSFGGISEVGMNAYPLLGEVVGVVLQIMNAAKTSADLVTFAGKRCLEMRHTYNFHALSAGRLRNGVLDETVRGKRLQGHRKCN